MGEPTPIARKLYDSLVLKGVPCEKEGRVGKKHVDILIEKIKLCIEIDEPYHYNSRQKKIDFERDFHSFKEGYYTLRIPDEVADKYLNKIAEAIAEIVKAKVKN